MTPEFERYEFLDVLGRGGAGEVLRVRDRVLAREVALKYILPSATEAASAAARLRFENEARILAKNPHPNLIPILDYGLEPVPFLVLPLVSTGDLEQWVRDRGPRSDSSLHRLADDLLAALEHLHSLGILHRDIKARNVLVDPQENFQLADFGLACFGAGTGLTRTGLVVGTPSTMAPEIFEQGRYSEASDLFAFGVTFLEALQGKPHVSPGYQVEPLAESVDAVEDPVWTPWLQELLAPEPRDRLQSASAARARLQKLEAQAAAGSGSVSVPTRASEDPIKDRAPSPPDPKQVRLAGAVLGLAVLTVLGWGPGASLGTGPKVASPRREAARETEKTEAQIRYLSARDRLLEWTFYPFASGRRRDQVAGKSLIAPYQGELKVLVETGEFFDLLERWADPRLPSMVGRVFRAWVELPEGLRQPVPEYRFVGNILRPLFHSYQAFLTRVRQLEFAAVMGKGGKAGAGFRERIRTRVQEIHRVCREVADETREVSPRAWAQAEILSLYGVEKGETAFDEALRASLLRLRTHPSGLESRLVLSELVFRANEEVRRVVEFVPSQAGVLADLLLSDSLKSMETARTVPDRPLEEAQETELDGFPLEVWLLLQASFEVQEAPGREFPGARLERYCKALESYPFREPPELSRWLGQSRGHREALRRLLQDRLPPFPYAAESDRLLEASLAVARTKFP